jgi:hypothetical protein
VVVAVNRIVRLAKSRATERHGVEPGGIETPESNVADPV